MASGRTVVVVFVILQTVLQKQQQQFYQKPISWFLQELFVWFCYELVTSVIVCYADECQIANNGLYITTGRLDLVQVDKPGTTVDTGVVSPNYHNF